MDEYYAVAVGEHEDEQVISKSGSKGRKGCKRIYRM